MTNGTSEAPGWMRKIIKESSISLVGSVVGTALNYALLISVTRYLDPAEFGTFALAQSVIAVAMVFVLCGTPRALDRFIPHYNAVDEQGKIRGLILGILRIASMLGVVVAIALLVLSRTLATSTFGNPQLLPVLRLMVISIPALAWIEIVATSFAGFRELRYRVYTHQLSLPILKIALALAVLSLGYGLLGWIWAYLAALFLTSALAWWFFRSRIWNTVGRTPSAPVDLKGIVSYCWPLSVNNLVLMLSGHVGILLLGAFRPASEAGVFRVYVYLVLLLVLVRTSFVQIYKPVAAGLVSTGDRAGVTELHKRVSKWMLVAASFFGLVVLLMGNDLLGILVPESYRTAVSALLLLAGARTVVAALGPQGMTLEAFGNTRISMFNGLLMLGVNIGLGRMLIPSHGVVGAAAALAVAVTVTAGAELIEVYALHRLHPFSGAYFRSLIVALGAGVVVYMLRAVWQTDGIARVAVLTLGLALLYVAGLRFSGSLDRHDYAVLAIIRDRVRGR